MAAIPLFRSTWPVKKLNKQEITMPFSSYSSWNGNSRRSSLKSIKLIQENALSVTDFCKEENFRKLSDCWRDIHGQNDWAGMLDPIDHLLRTELLRYGDMAQACYDAYDFNPDSKFCGSSKVNPNRFFQSLGWKKPYNYEVTSYVYTAYNFKFSNLFAKSIDPDVSWSHSANWIGYVAVSNDEYAAYLGHRDITIAWRGTVTNSEKIADLMDFQNATSYHTSRDPTIKVEAGFLEIYTSKKGDCEFCKHSAKQQVLAEVKKLTELYQDEELSITITGHSLGSALATLNAYDIAEIGLDVMDDGRIVPVTVFSFSGPRVGNARLKQRLEGLGVKVLRVFNVHDAVPTVPGRFFNELMPSILQQIGKLTPWSYFHIGAGFPLDHRNSPFLKRVSNPVYLHDLEMLLHLLDGYHGKGRGFWLANGRDIALVNKATDFLKDHFQIPPNWWATNNKALTESPLGQWMMPEEQNLEVQAPAEDIENHLQDLGSTIS